MESQKITNLLEHRDDDDLKFQIKKWYIINDQYNDQYVKGDENDSTIKFSTEIVKSFLVDYADACILVTGNFKVVDDNKNTRAAFKNCHQFVRTIIQLNDEHVDTAENLDLTINLYNLIEYSDNYADTTGSLYHYKRPEQPKTGDTINNLSIAEGDNFSTCFKYQSDLIKKQGNIPDVVEENRYPDVSNAHRLWKMLKLLCL